MRPIATILLLVSLTLCRCDHSQAQNVWQKYPDNPVLNEWSQYTDDPSNLKYAYEPSVIYDSTTHMYRMWFTSLAYGYGAAFRVSYALSPDGNEWYIYSKNPVFTGGPLLSFDPMVQFPRVIFDGKEYKMYYTGNRVEGLRIGLATSIDGKLWQRFSNNPILDLGNPGTWDFQSNAYCDVIFDDGKYYMWYTGGDGVHPAIGMATSTDGISWTKYPGNPVFRQSVAGWDSGVVLSPAVVKANGMFYMFYLGQEALTCCTYSIGVAHSADGITWARSPLPILMPEGSWEGTTLGDLDVVYHDSTFHMWYSAVSAYTGHWQTGYATSRLSPAGVSDAAWIPKTYSLAQSFPNPFNPGTAITYQLPVAIDVKLKVFDELGREVATLVDGRQTAGTHSVRFNAAGLSSGVYFYRLEAGQFTETKKMILLR
jgi:predicted GH43/DUF377 family glycosyl hydrolase